MSGSLCGLMAVAAAVQPRAMLAGVVSYVAMNAAALYIEALLVPSGVSVACHIGGFACGVLFLGAGRLHGGRWAAAAP
jgi:hypothetical protein